jgi:hypothetical protein
MNSPDDPPVIPRPRFPWLALSVATLVGALGWEFACRLSGHAEAWDSPYYWRMAYPAFAVVAFVFAYAWPRTAWFVPFAFALGQALAMFAKNPGGSLLPLGVILFGVMSLPLLIPARFGARLRARKAK